MHCHRPDRPRTLGWLPVVLALLTVTAGCAPGKPGTPTTSSPPRRLVVTKVLGDDSMARPNRQQHLDDAAVSADGTVVAVGWDHYINDVGVEKVDAMAWYATRDGRTWRRSDVEVAEGGDSNNPDFKRVSTAENMLGVTATPAGLIGVGLVAGPQGFGQTAAVWASHDGKAWRHDAPWPAGEGPMGEGAMNSVVTLGDLFVATGWSNQHGDTDAAVWTSRDGQRWTRVQDAALTRPGQQLPNEVIAAGPGLVMVGMDGSRNPLDPQDRRPSQPAVWTSTDGQKWQVQTLPVPAATRTMTYRLAAVTRGGPGLVAVGWAQDGDRRLPIVWTSHDGHTWQPGGTPEIQSGTSLSLRAVVSTGSTLAAFGESGPVSTGDLAVWTSTDARTWRPLAIPTKVGGGKDAQIVDRARALPDGWIIAVGRDGTDRASRPAAWLVEPRP